MILNDAEIRKYATSPAYFFKGKPLLDPFSEGVQGGGVISYGLSHAGYDLRLGTELLIFKNSYNELLDPKRFKEEEFRRRVFDSVTADFSEPDTRSRVGSWLPKGGFVIPGHSYALGNSLEYISIPPHLKGRCVGKSTLARYGLLINTTPLEPGWHGHLTIEIANIGPCAAVVYAKEGIAQLEFETLTAVPEKTYEDKKGKYQGQGAEPIPPRMKE